MRVISKMALRDFWTLHPESKSILEAWFGKATRCDAVSFPELGQTFNGADYVDGYTIFDVGGNRYRIASAILYDKQRIYVRAVMSHAEYDRSNWRKK